LSWRFFSEVLILYFIHRILYRYCYTFISYQFMYYQMIVKLLQDIIIYYYFISLEQLNLCFFFLLLILMPTLNFYFHILRVFFLYLHLSFFVFLRVDLFHLYHLLIVTFYLGMTGFVYLIFYCVLKYFSVPFQFFLLFLQDNPCEFSFHVQVLYVL
jgi:hypothetical protein